MDPLFPILLVLPFLFLKGGNPTAAKISKDGFFPPKPQPSFKEKADIILEEVENEIDCPGLHDFFMGAMYIESRFLPSAYRYEKDGYNLVQICNKVDGKNVCKIREKFKKNPWINQKHLFTFTGGLVQIFPGNALNSHDGTANNLNPTLVFDPYYNLAFCIDFAYRQYRLNGYNDYSVTRWLDIRYAWASLATLKNKTGTKAIAVEERIIKGYKNTGGNLTNLYTSNLFNWKKYANEFQFHGILEYILHFKNA